jgi:hypothetical protein
VKKINRALTPVLFFLVLASPCAAQDLPDPGRRLSKVEQEEDPEKAIERQRKAQQSDVFRAPRRDPEMCERARLNKQISCGAPQSQRSRSLQCTEAHAYFEQNCYY